MSWIGWLFLLAVFALVIVVLRGIVQLVSWFVEEFIGEPREAGYTKGKERPPKAEPSAVSQKPEVKQAHADNKEKAIRFPVKTTSQVRRPSRLGRLATKLKILIVHKGFDYWVACALSEDDAQMKIEYLSKALRLNPDYLPAWGMKGNMLFGLERYGEAINCFEKSLELHPSASIWHKKGICCYRLGQRQEALECFHKALETCPDEDRQLSDDIARMARLMEDELLRSATAS
jgi:tetratricopeptide (TPR) repeat protein